MYYKRVLRALSRWLLAKHDDGVYYCDCQFENVSAMRNFSGTINTRVDASDATFIVFIKNKNKNNGKREKAGSELCKQEEKILQKT